MVLVYFWGFGIGLGERYHFHRLADDEDEGLVCDLVWVGEEEEGEGYVEEGEGGYDGCAGDETHCG